MTEAGGVPAEVLELFLASLVNRGRGSYTVRSYRLGVSDFGRWLLARQRPLESVTPRDVADYVAGFAGGEGRDDRGGNASAGAAVDLATGRPVGGAGRAARTVNHRVSVLGSFFEFLVADGVAGWAGRVSPVPRAPEAGPRHGRPGGGDAPVRSRGELRRREPVKVARDLDAAVVARLIEAAPSWRDRALLLLLSRSGARIGDWSEQHGRHGVLGMELADLDRRTSTITVRLKGARDEHRVPVSAPFWAAFERYLADERGSVPTTAAWVGTRRGRGRPLTYAAFESGLRHLGAKIGVNVSAHMFRHTVATAMVEHGGVAVAQAMLGHRHVGTTIDTYAHIDRLALVRAVEAVEARRPPAVEGGRGPDRYAFAYDPATIAELDAIASPRAVQAQP